jgi:CubicO group peptidase (beta-lactamase class C family)
VVAGPSLRTKPAGITVRHVLQHTSRLPSNAAGGPSLEMAAAGTAQQARDMASYLAVFLNDGVGLR